MDNLIRMKDLPLESRPNIGREESNEYEYAGLCVESLECNGALVYIPYGIWCEVFNAMNRGANALNTLANQTSKSIEEMKSVVGFPESYSGMLSLLTDKVETYKEDAQLLLQIASLVDEV